MKCNVLRLTGMLVLAAALADCSVGPDYQRPNAPMSTYYKEQPGWVLAQPMQVGDRTSWWTIYNDPILDDLEMQVDVSNQNLKQAEAAYRQSQAVVAVARASFFPTVSANGSLQYSQSGGGGGRGIVTGANTTTASSASSTAQGGTVSQGSSVITGTGSSGGITRTYDASLGASWDIDVWGRIRRQVESDVANAQASAADIAAARLSAQGSLAQDYFELRVADQLHDLLDRTVADYRQSLLITQNQYKAGVAARTDVVNAEAQVEATLAQEINVAVTRGQLEHAIAVLVGQAPATFSIAPAPFKTVTPNIPVDMPSTLLERRPDIAAAERQLQAENALIGVAVASFYPDLTLSANVGYVGPSLSNLITTPNRDWSAGPQIAESIFDAGARSAELEEARAAYEQQLAAYRQTVLTDLQAVEDQLVSQRVLAQQADVEDRAVKDAEEAVRLTLNQYKAGIIVYTSVIVAENTALADEETALTLRQNRLTSSVALIEALGGGWDQTQLPTPEQIEDPTYGGSEPDACDAGGILLNIQCLFR